ncbi:MULTISPECIES: hypothetical protein [Aphanizomenon]|uniref:hypothetical protein n=1 Tax=Aphanizomenon TaxID=1175 RepID=UPI000543E76A|nr:MULTISPECIES: hypothetical protein [Aphanizomenon]KHG39306.1 hypothetical protein OA07_24455 [Aphanizomenon flos-aquae 2012/KM1/D3]MTJ31613.1 hypothetical protein [Aphanizomenon sp. UHCC 0183]QSV73978.1 MAG: hypothetical protein HEQ20_28375 [Aphanizomenon flos-aquae KM1D3_PB]
MTTDQPKETEFGELLVKIIKKPYIPLTKELLSHPSPTPNRPGQPHRLRQSKLSTHAYAEVRDKWSKIIAERNLYNDSHGLSYDLFMKMTRDLFGCEDVRDPEMPITREAVNHLVHTGNPWKKSKAAATVQDYNLQFLCCFTQEYTFDHLKLVGEKVLVEYHNSKRKTKVEPVKLTLDFSLPNDHNEDKEESLYLNHNGKITNNPEEANNLRGLIDNAIRKNGVDYFLRSGISAEELLRIAYQDSPKFGIETLTNLPDLLNLSLEEFVLLLAKDKDNPNAGF